jgi:Protein of unknown function (DUF2892)
MRLAATLAPQDWCELISASTVSGREVYKFLSRPGARSAQGLLVVLGVVLGWLFHPACFALSAFVGVGLVFSGVTDTCGMGLLLARMPWNRVKETTKVCSVDQHHAGVTKESQP